MKRAALVALLLALSGATACTPEEVMASHNAQAPCVLVGETWQPAACAVVPHDHYVFTAPEDERPVPLTPAEVADLWRAIGEALS